MNCALYLRNMQIEESVGKVYEQSFKLSSCDYWLQVQKDRKLS